MSNEASRMGVAARLDFNGEKCRLVFDDVSAPDKASEWRRERPFTSKEFDCERLVGLKLTKEELAQIGENLVIRLLALNGKL